MPARSTGCFQCRKRKIRCDETRPGCERCRVHGVVCEGYREPKVGSGEVVWRDETGEVVRRLGRKGKGKGRKGSGGSGGEVGVEIVQREGLDFDFGRVEDLREIDMCSLDSPLGLNLDLDLALVQQDSSHKDTYLDLDFHMARTNALYTTVPMFFASPAMEKALIYSAFMETYLPKRIGQADAHFTVLERLITTPDLRSEVVDALDALSLVQVGSVYKDRDLLRQSVKMYSKCLSGLLKTLSRNDAGLLRDDFLLATVTVLATCEFFDEIAQMGEGWSRHLQGSQELLARRGPDGVQTELGLMLYLNIRHGALSHALIQRKGTFLGTPEWRALAFRAPVIDPSTMFMDTALQVPMLLERYDNLNISALSYGEELGTTLQKAVKLNNELREWFDGFRKQFKSSGQEMWRLVDVTEFDTFCKLVSNRQVVQAFKFPNFMLAYTMSVYWNVMHFLRTTIKKMHMDKHDFDKEWFPETVDMVKEEELYEYVLNLCRCFPYFCEPSSSSTGQIGMFLPLRTAAIYCTQHGHWPLLRWVGTVRDNVFVKGLKPPSVQERRPRISSSKGDPRTTVVARPTDQIPQLKIAADHAVSFRTMVEE